MKNILFLLAFGVSTSKAYCQLIAEYRFEIAGSPTLSPYFVNNTVLTSASNAYFGTGLASTGFVVGPGGAPNQAIWGQNWSVSFDPTDHFGVTLTAAPATTVFVDSVTWNNLRSSTGPTTAVLRTSADGYTSDLGTWSPNTSWAIKRKVTSGLPSFSTALNIRIYGFNSTGTSGTFRLDSLRIYAHYISTLPVELLSFTGEVVDQDVELSWTTASELNNAHFEVLRSDDGQAWYKVGRVTGSGTTMIPRDYGFLDRDPPVGTNYYKLRQVDFDGSYEDSRTISVEVLSEQWFRRARGEILSDEPTMLFDELGRILSGPSREHKINRTGIVIIRKEDGTRSERLFFEP